MCIHYVFDRNKLWSKTLDVVFVVTSSVIFWCLRLPYSQCADSVFYSKIPVSEKSILVQNEENFKDFLTVRRTH